MNGNKRKNLLIVLGVALLMIILIVSVWIMPQQIYGYEGDGDTYVPNTTSSETASVGGTDETVSSNTNDFADSANSQLDKMKDEANRLIAGIDPGKFNNATLPSWVVSLGTTLQKYQVTICNSLFYLLLSFSGIWLMHGCIAVISDGYFQFFSKFKYNLFSKQLLKIKAEDGVYPEAGNRNNGNNGLPNGSNVQYGANNLNRNQQQQNGYGNNNVNGQAGGTAMSAAKEKLSVPIQIVKYIAMEALTIGIMILLIVAVKTGVLINLIASLPVWFIEMGQKIGSGVAAQ